MSSGAHVQFHPPLAMSAHGIRTFGPWQKLFAELLSGSPTEVKAFEFGKYGLLRFKWPYFNNRKIEEFYAWYFRL